MDSGSPVDQDRTVAEASPGPRSFEVAVQALQVAATQFKELNEALRKRRLLRESNTNPERPDEKILKKLDSSVKRNTALVKKLRQVSEDTKEPLIDEIRRTNQSKYVTEAKTALADANLKARDISAAVQVASVLHQRYADFGDELAAALAQALLSGAKETPDAERPSAVKRRCWLRLLAEVQALGIAGNGKLLLKVLQKTAAVDHEHDRDGGQASLASLAAFAKAGREEFLGLPLQLPAVPEEPPSQEGDEVQRQEFEKAQEEIVRSKQTYAEEAARRFSLPSAEQDEFRKVVEEAFQAGIVALTREHDALLETEQHNLRALNNRGELPEDMAEKYEGQRKALDNLQKALASLGDTLGRELPVLESSNTTRMKGSGMVGIVSGREMTGSSGPFDDEETRAFYESLLDVRAMVPAVLLSKGQESKQLRADLSPVDPSSPRVEAEEGSPGATEAGEEQLETAPSASTAGDKQAGQPGVEASGSEVRAEVEAVLRQILGCGSKDAADEAALAFCYVNSKGARKRLARILMVDSRVALHQLPFYARVVATLAPIFPDIPSQVLHGLEDDLAKLVARKDSSQRIAEERLRNARFLAELVKFRICPYGTFFTMLKSLLDDFSGYNIDTAAALVEAAGRFLFLLPETHQRMVNMLEVMVKLKNTKNVDAKQALAVDSAYVTCKPPERAALRKSNRPPQELYMRYLLMDCLTQESMKQVVRKLRRLPWAASELALVRCILSAVKGRFGEIPVLASLAASLSKYHPSLGVALADALLEEVRGTLEAPERGKYQRRVGHARLLGELYNYRLMDSRTVFDTLYLLLTSGHATPEEAEKLDPPSNYFRIRLVCVLLSACGQYFSKGSARQRLDRFLVYFQRYLLYKPPLPLDVEFDVQDMLEQLRPKLKRFESFEAACKAVDELEAVEAEKAAAGLPTPEPSESEADDRDESGASEAEGEKEEEEEEEEEEEPILQVSDDDDDDKVQLLQPIENAPPELDEEFEKEFAALTLQPPRTLAGQPLPVQRSSVGSEPGATVSFKVMLRKGGREDKTRAIQVPATLALAVKSKEESEADAAERAEMKRLVLQASQRDDDLSAGAQANPSGFSGQEASRGRGSGRRGRGYGARGSGRPQPARGTSGRGDAGRGRRSQLAPVEEDS